jgi:uncharacterized protein (TIGR02453 family)
MLKTKFPGFSPEALTFLRNLQRNNRREWFQPRKEKYEALIKAPMLELIGCLNEELARIAPNYVTPPQKAMYRIYRDTRFSKDKTPYKTHISGIFPRVTAVKREGAVLYFHFTPKELLVFGGIYSPEREELMAYRGLIQERHQELESILNNKKVRTVLGALQGETMTRMPKGYPVDHPAELLLRHKQWYLEATLDVRLVTSPRLVPEMIKRFELMAPFVEFMNQPFAQRQKVKKLPFSVF